MTARSLYREARARLAAMSVSDAELVAGELMRAFCGVRREELLLSDRELSEEEERAFAAALERRLSGEPLQYILGEWEFCGFPTKVRPGEMCIRDRLQRAAGSGFCVSPGGHVAFGETRRRSSGNFVRRWGGGWRSSERTFFLDGRDALAGRHLYYEVELADERQIPFGEAFGRGMRWRGTIFA